MDRDFGYLRRHIVLLLLGSQLEQGSVNEEDKDNEPSSSVTRSRTRKKHRERKTLKKTDGQAVDMSAKVDATKSTNENKALVN